MLTVQKLIDYLKTQDPDACVLGYEENSFAYISQLPNLPNNKICTVKENKVVAQKNLEKMYNGNPDAAKKIADDIHEMYRYAKDNDVIIDL